MKIIRKNRKKRDCGVVAAYNAASWCNKWKSYKEIEKLARSCGYNPKKGIYFFQFPNLMKKLKIPYKRFKPQSVEDMEDKLHLGNFLIFMYTPVGFDQGHIIVAFQGGEDFVKIINPDATRITWEKFVTDVENNGMKNFTVFKVPPRYQE